MTCEYDEPTRLRKPTIVYPRKARRAAADAATKWQRQHPPVVLWSMRVQVVAVPEEA